MKAKEYLSPFLQTSLVFAARYSHTRSTGGAFTVVQAILEAWDQLSPGVQAQLVREAKEEAMTNLDEWSKIIHKEVIL